LDQIDKWGHTFAVKHMWVYNFWGGNRKVYVNDCAKNVAEAADWALDGLREWAAAGAHEGGYFIEITRAWAKWGEGAGNTGASLGTTFDWLYLFSAATASTRKDDMIWYKTPPGSSWDLFDIYSFVFADKTSGQSIPLINGRPARAMVNVPGDVGLNPAYRESIGPANSDQTHHFAAYLEFGAHYGTGPQLFAALQVTGDYDFFSATVRNAGDYNLGILAANFGNSIAHSPGYWGKTIEAMVK
jgi:hypothetical protein